MIEKDNNMTQEEKDLLLKDLCGRLPYGVKAKITEEGVLSYDSGIGVIVGKEHVDNEIFILQCKNDSWCLTAISEFMPYLRPLSSMTEDEKAQYEKNSKNEWDNALGSYLSSDDGFMFEQLAKSKDIEWLNVHHFDYRHLIEKGLVLEAPEGMYQEK